MQLIYLKIGNLSNFKRQHLPANDPMANQQRFHCPTEKMTNSKNIHVRPDALQRHVRAIDRVLLTFAWN
jgi:hypothetical protein